MVRSEIVVLETLTSHRLMLLETLVVQTKTLWEFGDKANCDGHCLQLLKCRFTASSWNQKVHINLFKEKVHIKYTNLAQIVVPQWLSRVTGLSCHYSLPLRNIDLSFHVYASQRWYYDWQQMYTDIKL